MYEVLTVRLVKGTKEKMKKPAKKAGAVKINGEVNLSDFARMLIEGAIKK